MADENLQMVRALLDAAGVAPPDDEVERLAGLYPGLRKTIDRFHEIDTADEVTAGVFRAGEAAAGVFRAGEAAAGVFRAGEGAVGR